MGTRRLDDHDLPALGELATACGPTAWAHGGIDPARPPVYGCYAGPALAAAGTLQPWADQLLHLGIVALTAAVSATHSRCEVPRQSRPGRPAWSSTLACSATNAAA